MNLLIVDDEAKIRNGLRKHFERMPLRFEVVETAENAHAALESARRIRPEIVLSDIRMPGMDGLEFLETISRELSPLKTIVISGYDEFAYAQKAIRCGVNEYVLKPLDLPKFDAMIARIYDKLLDERNRKDRADLAIEALERNWEHLIDKLLTRFLNGEAEYEEARSVLSLMDAVLPNPSELLVFRAAEERFEGGNARMRDLTADAVRNMARELAANLRGDSLIFRDDSRNVVMLSPFDADVDFGAFCRAVRDMAERTFGIIVQWDATELSDTWARLRDAYKDAIQRLSRAKSYSDAVLRAKRLIEQRYFREDLSLQATAEELLVNPSHLSRQMRIQLGMGFVDYLTSCRMEKARFLLQNMEKEVRIYEIARKVGYTSQHYFTRVFTHYFGMAPLQYRATLEGSGEK
ncbi:MAG: response regulator [Synergistaceae bacterium]|nr:response regulator [Synergistaceae bacterium]